MKEATRSDLEGQHPLADLLPQHARLIEASAIAPEVAAARGYRSVTVKAELARLGFSRQQQRVPALLIPLHGVDGSNGLQQLRPDAPRTDAKGRPVKYETPAKARMAVDVPPTVRELVGDPSVPLFITEGIRKADAAASVGLCCIALLGVWNWRGTNDAGGKTILPDFEHVAMNGRTVHIAYDSDAATKHQVQHAMRSLKAALERRGAQVRVIHFAPGPAGEKVGLDDYLAAGHTVADLLALSSAELPAGDGVTERAGPYFVLDGRVCREQSTRDGPVTLPLCNFTARITAQEVYDDGADSVRELAIEGARDDGRPLEPVTVRAEEFDGLNWPTSRWGVSAVVYAGRGAKDHLATAVKLLSREPPERIIYRHFGWRKTGARWFYLHAGGAIGADGPQHDVWVDPRDGRLADYDLPDPPEGPEAREAIRASLDLVNLADRGITLPLLGAVYRAPLGEALPVDLSMFVEGRSGSQKTELTAIAQAHYGAAFTGRNLPGNWHSTGNALEYQAFLAKDCLFTVDDFAQTGTMADVQRLNREADRLFRAQGNRAGRQRMRADSTLRPEYRPRGFLLSSGEDLPAGPSLRARLFIVQTTPGCVDLEQLTDAQHAAADGRLARAMAAFLCWLAPRMDQLKRELPARHVQLRQHARETLEAHGRTWDALASLMLGWEVFLSFARDAGALSRAEHDFMHRDTWDGLCEATGAQQEHQAGEDPAVRFIALLGSVLESGAAHLASATDEGVPANPSRWGWRKGETWAPQGPRIGWLDGAYLLLEPGAALAAVKKLATVQGAPIPNTENTLWKRLADKGFITREGTHLKAKRTIAGSRKRVVCIGQEVLSIESGASGASGDGS